MPDDLTRLLLGAAAALGLTTALADPAAIERCRLEASAEARIACLEAALADDESAEAVDASDAPAVKSVERPPVPAGPVKRELPPTPPETMEQVQVPLDSANETESPAEAPGDSGIGAAQVKTAEQRAAELERATGLKVARYDSVPFRRLEVHLENGQVWRQIQGDTQEVRASLRKNQTVDIEESGLGGYKLRLNEMQRTIRVRRIR